MACPVESAGVYRPAVATLLSVAIIVRLLGCAKFVAAGAGGGLVRLKAAAFNNIVV